MRVTLSILLGLLLPTMVVAQPALVEPPDFPIDPPGPGAVHPGEGCFWLAGGSIEPGDVDQVQVTLPFDSERTVVDIDFAVAGPSSLLRASITDVITIVNNNDGNNVADGLCGLGADSDPVGSTQDSLVDLGETSAGAVIDVAITGANDFGFIGDHTQQFTYDVWVYALGQPTGCTSDADCADGVGCTTDTCELSTGECINSPDDSACANGLFCDGVETCDPVDGCQPGTWPCQPGEVCDEINGCHSVALPTLDVRPGACPNRVVGHSRGMLTIALAGTADFAVTQVDVTTLVLSRADGVGGTVQPNISPPGPHIVFEDVATPFTGEPCGCHSLAHDGIVDLVMKFRIPVLVGEFELDQVEADASVELLLQGALLDGTSFRATDCIQVKQRGHGSPWKGLR